MAKFCQIRSHCSELPLALVPLSNILYLSHKYRDTFSISFSFSHSLSILLSPSRYLAVDIVELFQLSSKRHFSSVSCRTGGGNHSLSCRQTHPARAPPFPGIQSICSKIIATPEYNSIPRLINYCCRCCL